MGLGHPHFFFRFAQCRRYRILITRFYRPAGKADLARMIGQMVRTLGQQHGDAIFMGHQGHQNARWAQIALKAFQLNALVFQAHTNRDIG
jgi:hypothetical protein